MIVQIPKEIDTILYSGYKYLCKDVLKFYGFEYENIYFTNDILEDVLIFDKEKCNIPQNTRGVTCYYNSIDQAKILLSIQNETNVYLYIQTMFHELTHVYDYTIFANYYGNKNIKNHPLYTSCSRYSEFHAYSLDEYYTIKFSDVYNGTNYFSSFFTEYENNLLPFHQKYINSDGSIDMYEVMRLLGHICAIDNFHNVYHISDSYIHQFVPQLFPGINLDSLYKLYEIHFLSTHSDCFVEFLPEIDSIENLMLHGETKYWSDL